MGVGRAVSAVVTAGAVCGCALLAVSMASAAPDHKHLAEHHPLPTSSVSRSIPAYRLVTPVARTSAAESKTSAARTSASTATSSSAAAPTSIASTSAVVSTSHSAAARSSRAAPSTAARRTTSQAPAPHTSSPSAGRTTSRPAPKPPPVRGGALPLPNFYTGAARRVITVVAHSTASTVATLQAWQKAPGGGWLRYGPAVTAHVGSQGLTRSPSEWKSATPIGSFSLTQAFGHYSDPGTPLPYFHTSSADWWISQAGSLYNTHQHCWSGCNFTQGAPNEHLYYETPYYNYAVVINYNRYPVHQGAGSAFFLHVSVGTATAGCVAIPQSNLVTIMRWLWPSTHPRILIGVA